MPPKYNLDTKIEALNLLDQHDGDFHLVKAQLNIPVKTLRGWRSDQDNLRLQYDDRQYRHNANRKLELINDMYESAGDIMKKSNPATTKAHRQPTRLHPVNPAQSSR